MESQSEIDPELKSMIGSKPLNQLDEEITRGSVYYNRIQPSSSTNKIISNLHNR